MRTLIAILFLFACLGAVSYTSDNPWTEKRVVEGIITEKWEDISYKSSPYKVMFAVSLVKDGVTTTYYERGCTECQRLA